MIEHQNVRSSNGAKETNFYHNLNRRLMYKTSDEGKQRRLIKSKPKTITNLNATTKMISVK